MASHRGHSMEHLFCTASGDVQTYPVTGLGVGAQQESTSPKRRQKTSPSGPPTMMESDRLKKKTHGTGKSQSTQWMNQGPSRTQQLAFLALPNDPGSKSQRRKDGRKGFFSWKVRTGRRNWVFWLPGFLDEDVRQVPDTAPSNSPRPPKPACLGPKHAFSNP